MKWFLITLGAVSVLGGLVTFWLPVPLGVPLFLIGIPLLMKYSPHARDWLLQLGRVHPSIEHFLRHFSRKEQE